MLECIVINGISNKYYYITLTSSVRWVAISLLSKWFGQWRQTWRFAPRSGVWMHF